MSQILIQQYLNNLQDLRRVSGTNRESVVREAFKDLLKGWARSHDLVFVSEYEITTPAGDRRYVDGALLYELRMPFGYWEAKDEKDDLDTEIEHKLRRGYPQDNIIFEDSTQAALIQNKREVMRCPVDDVGSLEKLLSLFFSYERVEIANFHKAVEQFKVDLPAVLQALREMIEKAHAENPEFSKAEVHFLAHAKEAINPNLTAADVREMLIQHILTEEIFSKVFGEDDFHRQNNVAKALYALEGTFFTGDLKKRTLRGLDAYYAAIRSAAAQIGSHHEKQTFLKVIYENFYKVYNVKAADRLGVVYTPNEIVRFMVESADWLCEKHFGKNLIDKDVDILDPATGTGTFICEVLEHFRGQEAKLKYKYKEELHANEVAILPYYVANLNIEATYAAITGEYLEFQNLCFVDTLDNVAGLRKQAGHMEDIFGSVSEENVARIKRQNHRRISVIIGNPPYNANQLNENENNKNREYPEIDKRIKETYIEASTAQKTKLYDMYARFFRWASDRLDENGVLVFITNRSFIDSRTFDGFRKVVAKEFNEIKIVDLGGDIRGGAPETRSNVFGIRVGVAISFFVKKRRTTGCRIYYTRALSVGSAEDKLSGLLDIKLDDRSFIEIRQNRSGDWMQVEDNDYASLIAVASKATKSARPGAEKAIFKLFTLGVVTARDEWVYDNASAKAERKINYLIQEYNADRDRLGGKNLTAQMVRDLNYGIKWTRAVKADLAKGTVYKFSRNHLIEVLYRPFSKQYLYFDRHLNEMRYQLTALFGDDGKSTCPSVVITDAGSQKPFMVLACNQVFDYHLVGAAAAGVALPLSLMENQGTTIDNVTEWGLKQFHKHYTSGRSKKDRRITKEAIFYYVYGVLHDPVYREKYVLNLKREFPRIPFYADFWQWADWGKELMDLHIGYETVVPWGLKRIDVAMDGGTPVRKGYSKSLLAEASGSTGNVKADAPRVLLKADKDGGRILLDTQTTLGGVPPEVWDYKLGNRSALEWILDQYKEKKPKDPTIREKFNTYRFADYKEKVIDLLMRVTTVSVRTVTIVNDMKQATR